MKLIILAVALVILGCATATAKPPIRRLAPPVPCTRANRMDVFIDEDNIMYECECQMLRIGTLCAWQVIGGVDAVDLRRQIKLRFRLVPRLRLLVLA